MIRGRLPLCLAGTVAALAGAAPAAAQENDPFGAADISTSVGVVDLFFFGPLDTRVQFFEIVGDQRFPLAAGNVGVGYALRVRNATTWRCDRLTRRFVAEAVTPEGQPLTRFFDVRTRPCEDRLAITVARRARPDRRVAIKVADRWRIGGLPVRVCLEARGRKAVCSLTGLDRGRRTLTKVLRAPARGLWQAVVRYHHSTVRRPVRVGPGPLPAAELALPRLFTTGDSTVQGIESFLTTRLRGSARVFSEFRVGTGISQSAPPDWRDAARRQAARFTPRVTLLSIGANEGAPLNTAAGPVDCCGEPWVAEYARRARSIVRAYARGGRGRVLWLTLPAPRDPRRQVISTAVNAAVTRAVAASGDAAVLVPLADLLTPGGRWSPTARVNGREVRVRSSDGVHLNVAGTRVAADLVAATLRARPEILGRR